MSLISRRSSRPFSLRLGAIAAALVASAIGADAHAGWPPPETAACADLKDPANWPNDPGWAPKPGKNSGAGESGAWEFFCWLPDRSPGSPPVRDGETSSGMSVDLAFRYTQGDPRVRIAILDSGIKWDEREVVEAAYLNAGELASHPPHHADGSACGGSDALAGFDCNGDGQLSVADYADEPSLTPDASDGHPKGDRNGNGVLDGGDLILNFSDGTDDDGNGYVDDISGWDFMKDDNDPYDDTRYGHGTLEARWSSGRANNGIDKMGTCPGCRFIPLRVGDSFIADVNQFAQAVVYATDNGVKVVQEALGTINNSRYTQAALDYAYAHGVTVVASMADENSRHHNMPAAQNHTLPTHAISPGPSDDATSASTFTAFALCSNFGAQNFMSTAAPDGCSSGATGRLSGMSGLLYSAGLRFLDDQGQAGLTAGEVQQLWIATTDDIDVPASRGDNPQAYWSQPGFDQRFGYGRPNANRAIEAVKAGKIPPEVDVVSPTWFEVLYADQMTAPVSIQGHVSALRAASYDYVVEAAGGVQPLDGEFKQVYASAANIPGSQPTAGELAQFDIRNFDITHERDVDSKMGENDYTVTVRIRATAHYGGEIGDVKGEMRRAYYIYKDPTLVKGFPIRIADSGESSPKLADIDGDGVRDIVLSTAGGDVHAYSLKGGTPAEIAGFPYHMRRLDPLDASNPKNHLAAPAYQPGAGNIDPDLARDGTIASPAVADMDGDGKPEIVVTTYEGTIYVVGSDGQAKPGWPVELPAVPSCPLDPGVPKPAGDCMDEQHILARGAFGSPVLADMNGDGKLDVIQAAFDGHVYVFQPDGTPVDGWPVRVHYTGSVAKADEYNRILTTPAVADLNGDGIPEVLVGSNEKLGSGGGAGAFYILDGRGTKAPTQPPYLSNWPLTMASLNLFPVVAEGVPNSPVLGDVDGDGKPEAIMHGNVSAPLVVPIDPGVTKKLGETPPNALPCHPDPNDETQTVCGLYPSSIFGELSTAYRPDTMFPLFSNPSAADLDQDGTLDVVASGGSLNMAINLQAKGGTPARPGDMLLAMWNGKTGAMFPGSPMVLEDFTFFNNQAIADVSGDGYPEVLTGSGGYFVHAYDACGREAPGFPKFTGQWVIATVAVGDIDGDHSLEIVTASRAGWLYAWHTQGKDDGNVQWESFHHDNRNTGYVGTKLDQGKTLTASTPLVCGGSNEAPSEAPEAGGGCGCETRQTAAGGAWLLAGLGLAAAAVARKRKRA